MIRIVPAVGEHTASSVTNEHPLRVGLDNDGSDDDSDSDSDGACTSLKESAEAVRPIVHIIARPLRGVCGETRRVVHVFPEPDYVPARLTAYCGASFGPGELELLRKISGMPCERCVAEVSRRLPEIAP